MYYQNEGKIMQNQAKLNDPIVINIILLWLLKLTFFKAQSFLLSLGYAGDDFSVHGGYVGSVGQGLDGVLGRSFSSTDLLKQLATSHKII